MTSRSRLWTAGSVFVLSGLLIAGCGGDDNDPAAMPEPERPQDARTFTAIQPSAEELARYEIDGATLYSGLHDGEHGQASYLIQVPDENWNGILVMYAHGYRGTSDQLTVDPPAIQQQLIGAGYAWAASSYSSNFYDARAGIEDTNALALAFQDLTNNVYGSPRKYYITGHSMGGHVAGAAIESETLATANNVVTYAGAVPMCGVMGDTELFDYFGAYNMAAQELAGIEQVPTAENYATTVLPAIKEQLWVDYANIDVDRDGDIDETDKLLTGPAVTADPSTVGPGDRLLGVLMNISGGNRPIYDIASGLTAWHDLLLSFGVPDGTVIGILADDVVDTQDIIYQFDEIPTVSPEEQVFNTEVGRLSPDQGANSLRDDGLRWIPRINGQFSVPVVSLHGLGDLFVPFSMEQVYARRAIANGSDEWLVQRAIRTADHCGFTLAEEWSAFQAMANWEQNPGSPRPAGDIVLDPDVVDDPTYGCQFTTAASPSDTTSTQRTRALINQLGAGCSST